MNEYLKHNFIHSTNMFLGYILPLELGDINYLNIAPKNFEF